jgi:hypothetical protein
MKDDDATLNRRMLWRSQGHCADSARLAVFLDPTVHALLNARPYFRWPSLDACAGGFAFLQGEDELDALAPDDIEDARFPGVRRWDSSHAWRRFVLIKVSGRWEGRWRNVRCSRLYTLACLMKVHPALMENCDARLHSVVFWSGHGDRVHSESAFVLIDPASHMLVHERPHLRGPVFDLRAGGFLVLQSDDELGALAVGDVEHADFPRVQRGDSGLAWECFVLVGLSSSG